MALDFPSTPTLYQTYTAGGKTWWWDGTTWRYGQPPAVDPYFANVKFLSHFNAYALDAPAGTVKRNVGATQILIASSSSPSDNLVTTPAPVATVGGMLSKAGAGMYAYAPADASYNIGALDFTIEFLFRVNVPATQQCLIDFTPGSSGIYPYFINNSSGFSYGSRIGGGGISFTNGAVLTANTWYFAAYSRAANVGSLYLNTARVGTGADAEAYQGGGRPQIGLFGFSQYPLTGYFTELRLTIGTGRYAGPTIALPSWPYPDQ